MNHDMHGKHHLIGMVAIGTLIAAFLLISGRSPGEALALAMALACPLMMIGMMIFMNRRRQSGPTCDHPSMAHTQTDAADDASSVPAERTTQPW
jgi:hypothetical protein